jgi:hypothetical protein
MTNNEFHGKCAVVIGDGGRVLVVSHRIDPLRAMERWLFEN